MIQQRVSNPKFAAIGFLVAVQFQLSTVASALQVPAPGHVAPATDHWLELLPEAASTSMATRRLLQDALDGSIDRMTMLQAALVASGVDDDALLRAYQAQFRLWQSQLRRSRAVTGRPIEKAAAIFEFLHKDILTGPYEREATDVSLTFGDGRFNCVSSLVLYTGLAEHYSLDVRAVETPGHVFCRLHVGKQTLDIETTCATWFQSGSQSEHELPESARRDSAAQTREIELIQLLAIIYYNRAVELLADGEFRSAVSANLAALRLDPTNQVVRGNLLASINNWALALSRTGQHREASELLARGLRGAPHYPYFRQNDIHVHQQWIAELWNQGRFGQAVAVLDAAYQRRPRASYLERGHAEKLRRAAASTH